MLAHFSKVLRRRPLLSVEHMMYTLLLVCGVWGLLPNNRSITLERLVNNFGVYVVVAQYTVFIIVGLYGHLSIATVRIEQRIQTSRLAFLAFAFGFVANILIVLFGGPFNPISCMLFGSWGLVAGIIFLHLSMVHRTGIKGRRSYS